MISSKYPTLHARRKKFERSTNVYRMALPWRPGWRNLLAGRPMGGNRFPDATPGALFRRVTRQLPYYVPPFVIANVVNLLLLVFLLGAVEVVPLFLGAILHRRPAPPVSPESSSSVRHRHPTLHQDQHDALSKTLVLGSPPQSGRGFTPAPNSATRFYEVSFVYYLGKLLYVLY